MLHATVLYFLSAAASVAVTSLDGSHWSLRNANGSLFINGTVTVPSTVPRALHAGGGASQRPTFGYNQNSVLDLMTGDNFTYSRSFEYAAAKSERVDLVLLGVDTASTVTLNGVILGATNDMHVPYAFDITSALGQRTKHELSIAIVSATVFAQGVAAAATPSDPNCTKSTREYWPSKFGHGTACATYVRKWTGSFGWDCTRAFVAQGLYKSVELRSYAVARINQVAPIIKSSRAKGALLSDGNNAFVVEVRAFVTVSVASDLDVVVRAGWPGGAAVTTKAVTVAATGSALADQTQLVVEGIVAKNVALWWTHDVGNRSQARYTLNVSLVDRTTRAVLDVFSTRVGFRTFEYVGSVGNESHGERWPLFFRLNGVPLFSKGFNWMPIDVLPVVQRNAGASAFVDNNIADVNIDAGAKAARGPTGSAPAAAQAAAKRARIADVRAIGGNTIRIWGGGVYEDETFYGECDSLGILVMQDGSFFGHYTEDPAFLATVKLEVAHIARRLAPHPSLAVWNGNNESPIYANLPLFIGAQVRAQLRWSLAARLAFHHAERYTAPACSPPILPILPPSLLP